jgi:hypothetical protein
MLFSVAKEGFECVLSPSKEGFTDSNTTAKYVAIFLALLLWLAVLLVVAQYLWNEVLCKVTTIVKPVSSVFQILGVVILLEIMYPR